MPGWGMNNNNENHSGIPVCPETMQNLPESSGPWFARNAEAEADQADTVDELMELVRVMAAAVLTPQQTVIFCLRYQKQDDSAFRFDLVRVSRYSVLTDWYRLGSAEWRNSDGARTQEKVAGG
jgi:hypothetical protein